MIGSPMKAATRSRARVRGSSFQPARRDQAVFLRRQIAAIGKPERRIDVVDVRNRQPALAVHALHAAEAGAGHRGAVIAVVAADEDVLLRLVLHRPEVPHHAQDGVVRLGARVGEEGVIQVVRRELRQLRRELDRRLGGALEEAVVVGQLGHLLRRHRAEFRPPVADVHAPQPGEGIQQLVALAIPDIDALAARQQPRAALGQRRVVVERMQVVGGIELLQGAGVGVVMRVGSGREKAGQGSTPGQGNGSRAHLDLEVEAWRCLGKGASLNRAIDLPCNDRVPSALSPCPLTPAPLFTPSAARTPAPTS
jgi:hypothetical protein